MKKLPAYTLGMGDRFGAEGDAQLEAVLQARSEGIDIHPVWNKSNREHTLIGTLPQSLRDEADAAVSRAGFKEPYFVDADHINLNTVDAFLSSSDFFTLDVADYVNQSAGHDAEASFIADHEPYVGTLPLGSDAPALTLTREELCGAARKFLLAIQKAGAIYRHIEENKGSQSFATEVSIDETDQAQTPGELFCILAMLAREKIPAQTVAPKFTGRFNKGVDYVGDPATFAREFDEDLYIIRYGVRTFGLPDNLKLSIHSGSDKFSLYPMINQMTKKHLCGLHVKTAGTTWLEEVIGLAEAGGQGLVLAKEIYRDSLAHWEDLVAPYRTVVDISRDRLPEADEVERWDAEHFASTLRHDPSHPSFNPDIRQLMHVGFKTAAKMGTRFTEALQSHRPYIARNVSNNLLNRHIRPLFG
ncbi:MAG: tagaturonate epimerase family protein [Candidatus Methylacidiphilales bacterium]